MDYILGRNKQPVNPDIESEKIDVVINDKPADPKPPVPNDKPPVPNDKPPVPNDKPPVPNDKPPVPNDKPPDLKPADPVDTLNQQFTDYKKNDKLSSPPVHYPDTKRLPKPVKENSNCCGSKSKGDEEDVNDLELEKSNDDNDNDIIDSPTEVKDINKINSLEDLIFYITDKKRRIEQSKKILDLKYSYYKRCHDFWNISTIILSSGLTFIESCKLIFLSEEEDKPDNLTRDFFNLSPIILGSIITCSASILKFKKYQENMEETYMVIDKCINMISRLKNKKEQIRLMKADKICEIKKDYFDNICPEYANVFQETEKYIGPNDYNRYLEKVNKIEYNKHISFHEKQIFFHKYKKDKADKLTIDDIDTDLKKCKKNECCLSC